jgi:hypothetical protein
MHQYFEVPIKGADVQALLGLLAKAGIESQGSVEAGFTARLGAVDAERARERIVALAKGLAIDVGEGRPSPSSPERAAKAMLDYVGGAHAAVAADDAARTRQN